MADTSSNPYQSLLDIVGSYTPEVESVEVGYVEEVGDGAVEDAVGDVAGGSPEEQRKPCGGHPAARVAGGEEPGEGSNDDDRTADEEDASPRRRGVGEHTKSDAWIAAVNEVDEVADKFLVPAFIGLGFEPGFGRAVDDHDGEGEPEPAKSSRDDQRVRFSWCRGARRPHACSPLIEPLMSRLATTRKAAQTSLTATPSQDDL